MKQGALIFDERSDRYDIRFDLADYPWGDDGQRRVGRKLCNLFVWRR